VVDLLDKPVGENGPIPRRADWTIDQGWDAYTPQDHATWKTLFERQTRLLPGRACDEFVRGMRDLPISADEIPDFRRLSEVLMQRTGWQVVAVPGLVPDEVFFEHTWHTGVSRPGISSASRMNWTTWRNRTSSMTCSATSRC
jgi:phenylalanine-4-hydroxylase